MKNVILFITTFLFVVKLIGDLLPIFKPVEVLIVPITTKLMVYEFGAFGRIWSDERVIVVILVVPYGAKRSIS